MLGKRTHCLVAQARLICAKMRSNIGKVMTSATSRFATGTILAPAKKKKKGEAQGKGKAKKKGAKNKK